ncbi:MAG: multicopper oxidase domain-containing protein [Dermatophilaceae bacterium]
MKLEPSAPMALPDRTRWHLGANAPVAAWLVALFGITLFHRYVPESPWLLVHLLLLGAVTNAIFVWSAHFTDALLRRRTTAGSRRWQAGRLVALNAGVVTVVAGIVSAAWILTLVGSVVVGAAAAAHGIALTLQARTALPSRFGATVRYYICASLALPIGAGLGATLARDPVDPWHGRLVVAHITLNLLGWIGLTVLGTLVTLWPTMLRTRISEDAERVARQALPILVGSVVVTVAGALAGLQALSAFGAAAYLGGVLWAVRPLAQVARTKAPSAYATWSVMAGVLWLVGSLLGLVVVLLTSPTWALVTDHLGLLVTPLAAGFGAQVLLGALSYLVPVVLGGGPTILRGTQARLERGNALRAMLINVGLVVCVLPVPSLVRVLVSMLVLGAFAAFLPLLGTAVLYALRGRRAARQSATDPPPVTRHAPEEPTAVRGRHTGLAAVAVALVVLAIAGGAALDPAAIGGGRNGSGVGASNGTMPHTGATAPASGHAGGGETSAGGGETSAAQDLDFMARPGAGFTARDATIPPLPPPTQRTHRVTMTVSEVDREVAVGVRQRLWTFNGTAPGPTLHGRVGDVFEVTLVNDGTIGHSIDFHAGALAPDVPMRTIEPGTSLSFRLTATHSGIWMYHCSSMPMSSHIADGMFGAVIIDPPGLAKVDREYVLEQSELYLGPQGGVVDAAKVAAEKPDAVVFNGFANQYDIAPLVARVGERVRIWVLAAGPNRGTSFHVVGGQFDTVFSEGAWLLRPGNASSGGSQVLSLGVAQGGFVEMSFPQAGHYPFVSHVMVDAERGAHGLFRVTP